MAEKSLKPCPFCGGVNLAVHERHEGQNVECRDCQGAGPFIRITGDEEEAIIPWNRRAPDPALEERDATIARLRAEVEHWKECFTALQRAVVGDTGLSAITEAPKMRARIKELEAALGLVQRWAQQRCPCRNEEPNPCPLCGASVENLEACKAVDETFPPHLKQTIAGLLLRSPSQGGS